jgi:hypothetical protein
LCYQGVAYKKLVDANMPEGLTVKLLDGTRQSQSYGVVVGREVQSFAGDAVGCSFDFSIDLQLLME